MDTSSTHTPGPWTLRMEPSSWNPDAAPYPMAVENAAGERVAFTCVTITSPNPEALANTRLIAAAPELLEALKAVLTDPELIYTGADYEPLDTCGFHLELRDKVRAAITKAEVA